MKKRYWIGGGAAALVLIAGVAGGGDTDDSGVDAGASKPTATARASAKPFPSATSTLTPSSTPTPVVEPVSFTRDDVVKRMRREGYPTLKNNEGLDSSISESCDVINNRPLTGPVAMADRKAWLKVSADAGLSRDEMNTFVDTLYQACRDLGYSRIWVKPATYSQEQAIGSAEDYLGFMAFSRQGLIDQLSSDAGSGYSVADATYAVDHLDVDWNQQAVKSARSYLEFTHFSRQGLIEQLSSPYGGQFTYDQAVYGVNHTGLR